jgi:antirestriction protein ArdC
MASSVYQYVTDRIISELEKGNIPWKKPWKGQKAINYITRKEYHGINLLLLPFPGEYLTFKQAKEKGGNIKKGEKSSMIVYYNWIIKENSEGKKESYPVLKYYNVFHISQCEGIETKLEPYNPDNSHDNIDQAEKTIDQYIDREHISLNIITGSDRAYYSPDNDQIVLPFINQFIGNTEYYSTAFHEMTHSTGHKRRLDRFSNMKSHKFGSQDYSREELVAEIGSTILCNSIGIEIPDTFKNSVGYIQGWLKALKNDIRLITVSAGQANKAVNYILGVKDSEKVENN